LQGLPSDDLSI
jgi:dynein heavy chain